MVEVLQHSQVLDGRHREVGHAQLATRAHLVRRQTREENSEVLARTGLAIRGAHAIVDGAALLGRFAEAELLDGLRNPDQMNRTFTIVGLRSLDKENRFKFC